MPEGDQTKWRGIRPVDPPEDIPVTLGAEVPHVIVDSGGGAFIKPRTLHVPVYYFTPTVIGNWYTHVNEVAAGWLFYTAYRQQGTAWNGWIGITIDGGARQALQMYPVTNRILPVFQAALNIAYGFHWYGLRFDISLKVEYRQDGAGWHNGTCCYGLE